MISYRLRPINLSNRQVFHHENFTSLVSKEPKKKLEKRDKILPRNTDSKFEFSVKNQNFGQKKQNC